MGENRRNRLVLHLTSMRFSNKVFFLKKKKLQKIKIFYRTQPWILSYKQGIHEWYIPSGNQKNSHSTLKFEPIPRLDIQALFLSTLTADKSSKKWPLQSSTTSCFHYDRTNIVVVIICLLFFWF